MAHDEADYGKPLVYDPDFNGPLKRRSCTDVICCALIFVFVAIWMGIGIYAFTKGDVNVLLVPKDSKGSRCGLDSHVADRPYLLFFDLTKCLKPIPFTGCDTPQVCVKECPDKLFLLQEHNFNPNDMICLDEVEKPQNFEKAQELVNNGKCAEWYLLSKSVQKRCVPNIYDEAELAKLKALNIDLSVKSLEKIEKNINVLAEAQEIGRNIVDDIAKSWWKIAVMLVFAMLVCIIYIVIMRWIAGIMVWISIFGAIAVLAFCVYYSITKYIDLKNNPLSKVEQEEFNQFEKYLAMKDTWLVLSIISSITLLIILLMLIFLRKRIVLAIALISEASKAVSSATAALFFPILPFLLQIGIIAFAVLVALYLFTVGDSLYVVKGLSAEKCCCKNEALQYKNDVTCDPKVFAENCYEACTTKMCVSATCHFLEIDPPKIVGWLHAYNVLGFFWILFFISAFGEMVLAATFATWYWTFRKSNVPFFTVTEAILRTLRYHIGTLAFGSLIIAICRIIRVILEYIDYKLRMYDNVFTKAVLCCCKCFCWCLENFLRFINRNAYIMCAIHGSNFCVSAKDAFSLLMRNIIRVFVLDKVTDFLMFLSKVMITAGVVCIAYAIFIVDIVHIGDSRSLNYSFVPVIIIGVGTYFITTIFFSVFTMAVDTLFLCFLEDSERNDGSPEKPFYMSKELRKILGKKNM